MKRTLKIGCALGVYAALQLIVMIWGWGLWPASWPIVLVCLALSCVVTPILTAWIHR